MVLAASNVTLHLTSAREDTHFDTSMNVLIVKLGATGDVARTTLLLSRLTGEITWLTAAKNKVLLEGLKDSLRCVSWEQRESVLDVHYDLAINLGDTLDVAEFLKTVRCNAVFGTYVVYLRRETVLAAGNALGTGTRCVTLFTSTGPWEIHDYGVQKKIVSPLLEQFFYKRGYEDHATTAVSVDEVFSAAMTQLEAAAPVANHIAAK